MSKVYYKELDLVKGIAILLVILGHSFCTYPINLNVEFPNFSALIRGFQMPLFFIASGFLFSISKDWGVFLKSKLLRLLMPWFMFSIVSLGLKIVFSSFTRTGEISILDGFENLLNGRIYWFLYVLFEIMILVKLISNRYLLWCTAGVCMFVTTFTSFSIITYLSIYKVVYYIPYFVLGMELKRNYENLMIKLSKSRIVLITIISLIVYISALYFNIFDKIYIIIPIAGSIFAWGISLLLVFNDKLNLLFTHFGHYSLQYYLNHLLIMLPIYLLAKYVGFSNNWLTLFFIFVLATIFSYVMLQVELKIKTIKVFCGL